VWQLYHVESIASPGTSVTVAILRVMVKDTLNRFIVEEKLMVGLVICMSNN